MNTLIKSVLCLFLAALTGCAHIPFLTKPAKSDAPQTATAGDSDQALISSGFVQKGRIIDSAKLVRRADVAVIPFTAGVGVEANETLDQVSLMIVGGIADAFQGEGGQSAHFRVLTADDKMDPDLVIQGHVTNLKRPSAAGRWLLGRSRKTLGIEGEVVEAKTGNTVVIFVDRVETKSKKEDYSDLGRRIGQNIGQFILSGAGETP